MTDAPDPAPPRRSHRAPLIALRVVLCALTAACSWVAYEIYYNGPNGSGSAMTAAVRVMLWAVGLALAFFTALLLTFCTWRRPGPRA